jgi:hypothetical protein
MPNPSSDATNSDVLTRPVTLVIYVPSGGEEESTNRSIERERAIDSHLTAMERKYAKPRSDLQLTEYPETTSDLCKMAITVPHGTSSMKSLRSSFTLRERIRQELTSRPTATDPTEVSFQPSKEETSSGRGRTKAQSHIEGILDGLDTSDVPILFLYDLTFASVDYEAYCGLWQGKEERQIALSDQSYDEICSTGSFYKTPKASTGRRAVSRVLESLPFTRNGERSGTS